MGVRVERLLLFEIDVVPVFGLCLDAGLAALVPLRDPTLDLLVFLILDVFVLRVLPLVLSPLPVCLLTDVLSVTFSVKLLTLELLNMFRLCCEFLPFAVVGFPFVSFCRDLTTGLVTTGADVELIDDRGGH